MPLQTTTVALRRSFIHLLIHLSIYSFPGVCTTAFVFMFHAHPVSRPLPLSARVVGSLEHNNVEGENRDVVEVLWREKKCCTNVLWVTRGCVQRPPRDMMV